MANKYIYDGEDIVSIVFDEGSVYWAIKQMIDGKVVRKKDGRTIYESCSSNDRVRLLPEVAPFHTDLDCTISMEEFIAKNLLVSDFEIYQNPKLKHSFKVGDRIVAIDNPALDYIIEKLYSVGSMPYAALRDSEGTLYGLGLFEIDTKDISSLEYDLTLKYKAYEEPKFKSGDWIRDKRGNYYQVSSYISNSGVYTLRKAGQDYVYVHKEYGSIEDFELTTLEPDFSNAKMCDDVFSTHYGYAKVHAISPLPKGQYRMWLHVPSRKSSGHYLEEVLSDNKSTMTTGEYYPTLFHDHHQAQAYFGEIFRKMTPRGDKPCNQ